MSPKQSFTAGGKPDGNVCRAEPSLSDGASAEEEGLDRLDFYEKLADWKPIQEIIRETNLHQNFPVDYIAPCLLFSCPPMALPPSATQEFLDEVERKLNERPRKRHGFLSQNQVFSKSTGLDAGDVCVNSVLQQTWFRMDDKA